MADDRFAVEEGGGGLEGFTGVVTDAFWQENDYGWSLCLVSLFDDPENYPSFENGTYTQFFGPGKDWASRDGGTTIEHPEPSKRFNANTKMGKLVKAFGAIPDVENKIPATWSAYNADAYKGLHLVWARVPDSKRAPKVDAEGNRVVDAKGKEVWEEVAGATIMLPVGFAVDGQESLPLGELDVATLGLSGDMQVTLAKVAADAADDAKFIEGVTKVPGAVSVTTFMAAVSKNTTAVREALAATII